MKKNLAGSADDEIRYATGESSLGTVLVARGYRGVRAILLGHSREDVEREASRRFPGSLRSKGDELRPLIDAAVRLVERPAETFEPVLDIRGTPFQRRVWSALRQLPPGTTTTYADLATRIGAPGAARAVGSACGANPIAVAVPCHRVLRVDGSLSGYRWGLHRKKELLRRESPSLEPERAA